MEVAIAILLALILVAMVSSNKHAAEGVKKAIELAFFIGGLSILWVVVVAMCVWYYAEYPRAEWERMLGIGLAIVGPPLLAFLNWKSMWIAFSTDKKKAAKWTGMFVGGVAIGSCLGFFYQEMKRINDNLGWTILIVSFLFCVVVLMWRSITGAAPWRDVWFGKPPLDTPWEVVRVKRLAADKEEDDFWAAAQNNWEDLTVEQQETYRLEAATRQSSNQQRLTALEHQLELEYAQRAKDEDKWSVRKTLLWVVIFCIFGLARVLWDFGVEWMLETKQIKGRVWMAWLAVGGLMVLAGSLLVNFAEAAYKYVKLRSPTD